MSDQPKPVPNMLDMLEHRDRTRRQLAAVMTQWADNKDAELRRWFATGQVNTPERPAPRPVAPPKKKKRKW